MLFERTCRIAQDFDWFLRFVPQNSVEKRKNSKNHPESCIQKQAARFLSPACFDMFEPSKTFYMFLFLMPGNREPTLASKNKDAKIDKNQSENCKKNRQHDSFACLLGNVRAVKGFFHVSFYDTSKSSANAAQLRLKSEKSTRINQKTAQKTGSTILSPACFDMFEPSKAFSMFLFMMPANQAASHCNQNQNANDQRCHLPVAFP